jgi:hypothetical protein
VTGVDGSGDNLFAEVYSKTKGWVSVCAPTTRAEAARLAAHAYSTAGSDGELPLMVRLVAASQPPPPRADALHNG